LDWDATRLEVEPCSPVSAQGFAKQRGSPPDLAIRRIWRQPAAIGWRNRCSRRVNAPEIAMFSKNFLDICRWNADDSSS
jgi:hypothetical protein